jgi:hypothetical protein
LSSNLDFGAEVKKLHDFSLNDIDHAVTKKKQEKRLLDGTKRTYYSSIVYKIGLKREPVPMAATLFLPMVILTLI